MVGSLLRAVCKLVVWVSYVGCAVSLIALQKNEIAWIISLGILIWMAFTYYRMIKIKNQNIWTSVPLVDLISTLISLFEFNRRFIVKIVIEERNTQNSATLPFQIEYASITLSIIVVLLLGNMYLQTKGCNTRMVVKGVITKIKYRLIYSMLLACNNMHLDTKEKIYAKILHIEPNEISILEKAASYHKEMSKTHPGEYPVILRTDAELSQLWKKWDYDLSLISTDKISINFDDNGTIETLRINMAGSNLAIISNYGKAFLRKIALKPNSIHNIQNNIEYAEKKKSATKIEINGNQCFLRWGSAGVLPIVHYRNDVWVMMLFRDIQPIGWNLPLGGSKNEEEKMRPAITALRELLEEVIVVEHHNDTNYDLSSNEGGVRTHYRKVIHHQFLDTIRNFERFVADRNKYYAKQHAVMKDTYRIEFSDNESSAAFIKCEDIATHQRICTRNDKGGSENSSQFTNNIIFVINPEENGLECVKPIVMSIDGKCEFRMGEIDYSGETWINSPVILVKYDAIKTYFEDKTKLHPLKSDRCMGGIYSQVFNDPNNYILFHVDVNGRNERIKEIEKEIGCNEGDFSDELLETMIKQKSSFVNKNKRKRCRLASELLYQRKIVKMLEECFIKDTNERTIINSSKANNYAMQLCPTTWKALCEAVAVFDASKIGEYCKYTLGD